MTHIACGFLSMAFFFFFAEHTMFDCITSSFLYSIPLYGFSTVHLFSIEGYLDGFQDWAVMITTMISICYSVSCEHKFLCYLNIYLRGILLGCMGKCIFKFRKMTKVNFSKVAVLFLPIRSICQFQLFFVCSLALSIFSFSFKPF